MSWFLTREQRAQLKKLDRLNEALMIETAHIERIGFQFGAAVQLSNALARVELINDAIHFVATNGGKPQDRS